MISAIVRATVIEALRNRVTVVVAAFAVALILMTQVVVNVTAMTLDRAITDFGLGAMSVLLVALSLYLSIGTLQRDFDRRALAVVLARPISRGQFLVGRYLGILATLAALLLAMSVLYLAQLLIFGVQLRAAIPAAILGLLIELGVLSALGIFFSTFAGTLSSIICVAALYAVGHVPNDLYNLSYKFSPLMRAAARGIYWGIPNLDRLDFRVAAAHALAIDWATFTVSAAYGLAWAVGLLGVAVAIFSTRDVR